MQKILLLLIAGTVAAPLYAGRPFDGFTPASNTNNASPSMEGIGAVPIYVGPPGTDNQIIPITNITSNNDGTQDKSYCLAACGHICFLLVSPTTILKDACNLPCDRKKNPPQYCPRTTKLHSDCIDDK